MMATSNVIQGYRQPAFLTCVTLLALSGLGVTLLLHANGGMLQQKPLPLKRPLSELDRSALAPFEVVRDIRIDDPELLESLGTEDYLQWVLRDRDAQGLGEQVLLFVTYYPKADRVPHVPEECYLGSGYQQVTHEPVVLNLETPGVPDQVLATSLVFEPTDGGPWSQRRRVPVLYLFNVNWTYATDRDEARLLLNRGLWGRSSYFCKVELVFNQQTEIMEPERIKALSTRVLQRLLPALAKDHWPSNP